MTSPQSTEERIAERLAKMPPEQQLVSSVMMFLSPEHVESLAVTLERAMPNAATWQWDTKSHPSWRKQIVEHLAKGGCFSATWQRRCSKNLAQRDALYVGLSALLIEARAPTDPTGSRISISDRVTASRGLLAQAVFGYLSLFPEQRGIVYSVMREVVSRQAKTLSSWAKASDEVSAMFDKILKPRMELKEAPAASIPEEQNPCPE